MGRLDGKVCVITGAGSGIGQASALLFAREGARVVVSDIDLDAGRDTAQEITKAGGQAVAEQVDVTDEAQTADLAERVVRRFERVDVLFNNAGIGGGGRPPAGRPRPVAPRGGGARRRRPLLQRAVLPPTLT